VAVATTFAVPPVEEVAPGSFLDLLYRLLQDIDYQLKCRNQVASSWIPRLVNVPVGAPGLPGFQLCAQDRARLGLVIVNTDAANTLWVGPDKAVGYPGASNSSGLPIFAKQAYSWNLDDADRNMARYALAQTAVIQVCVTEIH